MTHSLYVIIVTYNAMRWLDRCLSSLYKTTIKPIVIVIDNCSVDGTPDYIKSNYPEVTQILSKDNLGFGRANNLGLEIALKEHADYVYLLNQDAWVQEETFEVLIETMQRHPEFALLSPWQKYPNNKTEYWFEEFFNKRENKQDELKDDGVFNSYSPAAHWMLSRQCVEKIGGFSPSFPHYGEDENYMQRIIWHGMKVGVCNKTAAVHDTGVRTQTLEQKFYREYISAIVEYNNPLCQASRFGITWRYFKYALRTARQFNTMAPLRYFRRFLMSSSTMSKNLKLSKSGCCPFLDYAK